MDDVVDSFLRVDLVAVGRPRLGRKEPSFQALRLWERGQNQSEIARQLRVVRQTVARWVQQYRAQGPSALRKAGRAGRKPRLSDKQGEQLTKLLLAGPERLGSETLLWTCPRVVHLIEQEFGVHDHEGHGWKRTGVWSSRPEGQKGNSG